MLVGAELVDLGCGLACISSATHQSSTRTGDMIKYALDAIVMLVERI